jgi:Xaa-Pro aminopeptidase
MARGDTRIEWISTALTEANLDALLCTIPENVLMLSGYAPVVGTSAAIATRDGRIAILAPEDERELAVKGWAGEVRTYAPGLLTSLTGPIETIWDPLANLVTHMGLAAGRLGYEDGDFYQGSMYAAMYFFGAGIYRVLETAVPRATLVPGAVPITRLRSLLTADEVAQVRLGCQIAGEGFVSATQDLRPGLREPQVAAAFATPISIRGFAAPGVELTDAFTWCMSGENSALAGAAYARTRDRELRAGDLVLVHCNSSINGYWTDITRTYCLGQPDHRQRAMYEAVLAARAAALAAIHPGVRAADVDAAARAVLTDRGFGQYFTHGVGHNVGFSVISAEFPPRLHPASPDVLSVGMTFNIEPAIYIKGYGGIRHCDVVTVQEDGPELLTPFQADIADLIPA